VANSYCIGFLQPLECLAQFTDEVWHVDWIDIRWILYSILEERRKRKYDSDSPEIIHGEEWSSMDSMVCFLIPSSRAGTISVVGNLNDLVQLLSKALEVAGIGVAFLAVDQHLFLACPSHVLQKVNVGGKGVIQGSLGAAAFLQVLLVVRLEESLPQVTQTKLGLLKNFLKILKPNLEIVVRNGFQLLVVLRFTTGRHEFLDAFLH